MHMKRTADRLFGDAVLLVGARRRPQPDVRSPRMSAVMGGNVRVGLEDSLWLGRGQLAKSNAEQVAKARRMLEELGLAGRHAGRRAPDAQAQRRQECRFLGC